MCTELKFGILSYLNLSIFCLNSAIKNRMKREIYNDIFRKMVYTGCI
jgi:hypothetical protein